MRFSIAATFAAFVACASTAAALVTTDTANPITQPIANSVLTSGVAFNVQWAPNVGKTVTLTLRKGSDPSSLDTLEVIAENLPNNGVFIWVPSKQLSGDHDYAIEIKSSGPETQNFSALFKIISSGPGIKGTTVVPSTTRAATATYTGSVAVYTGSEASATDDADPSNLNKSAAGSKFAGLSMLVAAAVGMVAGGMLVL